MVYPFLRISLFPIIRLLIKKIEGANNIPNGAPFIVVSNHQSYIDPLLIIYAIVRHTNEKVHFISSPKWWYFLGDAICKRWAGCILLFNSNQAYEEAREMISSGKIVGVFPENFLGQKKKKLKTGAVRLSIETNVPILPIGLSPSYIPLNSRIVIGKARHASKSKDIRKQASELMEEVYVLMKKGMQKPIIAD